MKLIFYCIISIGIIGLLCFVSDKIYIKLFCQLCKINEAQLFLIIDNENRKYLVQAKRENFYEKYKFLKEEVFYDAQQNKDINNNNNYKRNSAPEIFNKYELKKSLQNSFYIGEDYLNDNEECIIIDFKYNKYFFSEVENSFVPLLFNLNEYSNNEIHEKYSNGINDLKAYNYLWNKFGENIMRMKNKTFFGIVLKRIYKPMSIYQLLVIVFWMFIEGYKLYPVILFFYVIILYFTSYQKYMNYKKIFNENEMQEPFKIHSVINSHKLSFYE